MRAEQQKLDELDIDNLIEEIEGLTGRDQREIWSRLKDAIGPPNQAHLYQYS